MKTITKIFIATGLLFAIALPIAACANKAPRATLIPAVSVEAVTVNTDDMINKQEPVEMKLPVEHMTMDYDVETPAQFVYMIPNTEFDIRAIKEKTIKQIIK